MCVKIFGTCKFKKGKYRETYTEIGDFQYEEMLTDKCPLKMAFFNTQFILDFLGLGLLAS